MNSLGRSVSYVVPKVSLHLHLLTGGHFGATQAGGASVGESRSCLVHPLGPPPLLRYGLTL